MEKERAVNVDQITKAYGNVRAVDNISFDVYRNEIFAMLGPNGAGKSTTIRMILDILRPDSGTIRVLGNKLNESIKDRIGYLPEERGLYSDTKVLEMMTYLGTLKGMSTRQARERSMELLRKLELDDKADSKVKEFSKGMQQKVQFAVTILHKPDLVIVDEPFSGLDPVNTQVIKDMIFELRDAGTAVVMSTHQMYQVEEMADRLMMINRGQRVLYGTVDEVRESYASHAVIVEGDGVWDALPGVVQTERDPNSRNGIILRLTDGTRPDELLSRVATSPDYHISRFELAVPSLNDIFIEVAGERLEDVEAEYAQQEAANV